MAANYNVGNLQISASLREGDLEHLKKGLSSLKRLINSIGNIDSGRLDTFSRLLSDLTTQFTPFLREVSKASGGLNEFNKLVRRLGVDKINDAVEAMRKLREESGESEQPSSPFVAQKRPAGDTVDAAESEPPPATEDLIVQEQQVAIAAKQQEIAQLKASYAMGKSGLSAEAYTRELEKLELEMRRLSGEVVNEFGYAQIKLSKLQSGLFNQKYLHNRIPPELLQEYLNLRAEIEKTTQAVHYAELTEEEKTIADYKAAVSAKQQQIAYLEAGLALNKFGASTREKRVELERLRGELEELQGTTKKTTSSWKKFLGQVKRIAIYRLIRYALRAIVNTMKETIDAFAQVDDNIDHTVSQLSTSLQFIKLGAGSLILPLLEAIAPIVEQIGYAFADLGNAISASLSKDGKFTKINTKAWKEYRKQVDATKGSLLDFDKFRSLSQSGNTDLSSFLDPNASVEEYLNEEKQSNGISNLVSIMHDLGEILSDVFEILQNVGKPILDTITAVLRPIADAITPIIQKVAEFVGWLDEVGALEPIIISVTTALIGLGAYKVITKIGDAINTLVSLKGNLLGVGIAAGIAVGAIALLANWDKFNNATKQVITILGTLVAVATAAAVAVMAFMGTLTVGVAIPLITAAVAAGAIAIRGYMDDTIAWGQATAYKEGGLPDKGTLFYAGEAGAEMVYNTPSGQSGVANISQIEEAFYNALTRYGREGGDGTIVVQTNIDGQKIFESVQRKAAQHGLGFARK